jgi:hypothetical protein
LRSMPTNPILWPVRAGIRFIAPKGEVMTKQNDHPPKKDEDEDEWEEVGTETVTGAIVSVEWARSHPDSCVVNRVKKPKTP